MRAYLRRQIRVHNIAVHTALFLVFLPLTYLSTIFELTELRATPWKPETGIAVAAGLLLGRPAMVSMAAAIFVSTKLWGWPLPGVWEYVSALLRAGVFVGFASVAAPYLMRYPQPTLQTIIAFLGFSVAVTLIYAPARGALLWVSDGIDPDYLFNYSVTLSIGNLLGILTVVPLFLATGKAEGIVAYLRSWSFFHSAALLALVVTSMLVFATPEINHFKFFYLIFVPVIVFSIRDGYAAAAFSVLLSDLLMLGILYARDFQSSTVAELQVLMLSLSVTGLLLGTAISERAHALAERERSHLRLQESQAALLQASRLSLASEMAAALAHELNQPLTSVRNYIRAVRRRLDSAEFNSSTLKSDIDAAVSQVDEAASLIRSTRGFLQRGNIQLSPTELEPLISSCAELVVPELRRAGIALEKADMSKLPPVVCNKVQIQQVVMNIVRNAKEAIVLGNPRQRAISIKASASVRPGFLEVAIADSGPGVAPEMKRLLFQPLHSSKPEGLGLGLSLCNTIIRSHGGEFWLDDRVTSGARFVFTLPCSPHDFASQS